MKFKDYILLEEMFESDNGYKTSQRKVGDLLIFDILTNEARDYRFIFTLKNDLYLGELGYAKDDNNIVEIKSDFYDVNKLISTLIGIFTGFYMYGNDSSQIIYKFHRGVDKGYKLLVHSLFKKELKNYFNEIMNDTSDYGDKNYIVIKSNRNTDPDPTDDTILKVTHC